MVKEVVGSLNIIPSGIYVVTHMAGAGTARLFLKKLDNTGKLVL